MALNKSKIEDISPILKKIYNSNQNSLIVKTIKNPYLLRNIILVAALVALYVFVGCPLKQLFGISCPGCGMTRALLALFSFDISAAVRYHPMVLALPPAGIVYLFRKHIPSKVISALVILFLAALLAVYIFRLVNKDEIVVFDFCNSAIYKLFKIIKS